MKSKISALWKFINTPIIILLLACLALPLVLQTFLSVIYRIERLSHSYQDNSIVLNPTRFKEVRDKIIWSQFEMREDLGRKDLLFFPKIKNESNETLTAIRASLLIYDEEGKLLDVTPIFIQSEYLFPGEEYTAKISIKYGFSSMPSADLRAAVIDGKQKLKFEGRIDNFSVIRDVR